MDIDPGTVTVWQSGRLAPHRAAAATGFGREQWLEAALLLLCVAVLAVYVAVLERDIGASAIEHMAQRARAAALAQCEADHPAEMRGRCIALSNGDVVAAEAPPMASSAPGGQVGYEQEDAARALTVSLLGQPR